MKTPRKVKKLTKLQLVKRTIGRGLKIPPNKVIPDKKDNILENLDKKEIKNEN